MLCAKADGKKLKLFIIFNGVVNGKIMKEFRKYNKSQGAQAMCITQNNSWCDRRSFKIWCDEVFSKEDPIDEE